MKLKGRTHRLLSPMSQLGFVVQRRVVCCICRQNSRCLCESSNHLLLDKKQMVSQPNERNEMWQRSCVNWIPFIATPKERSKKWWAKWPTSNDYECVLRVEYQKHRKNQAWVSLGLQLVGHVSHLWWDRVCDICKFWPGRSNLSIVVVAFVASQ